MTTAQESTNGHPVFQPPASVENPAEFNSAGLPANQDNNNHFPAGAYHVPPRRFAPRPNAYAYDDSLHRPPETQPLPDRCQFMFSDGRQCTMARSDIHPSLCVYHSDREEQLFGDPSYRCETRKLDFPELFSACRDLSTAAGVNRALAQVFRLLAQRRISRQEAATFGHLAKLLLRSISLMNAESTIESEEPLGDPLTRAESVRHSSRSGSFMRPSPEVVIPKTSSPLSAPTFADRAESGRSGEDEESRRRNGVQQGSTSKHFPPDVPASAINPQRISTSAPPPSNSTEISTYEIVKASQNQHLQKNWNGV